MDNYYVRVDIDTDAYVKAAIKVFEEILGESEEPSPESPIEE